jgi:hypothetical protein
MKLMKLFLALMLLSSIGANAQIIADPTTWSFEAKKIKDNDYELSIQCKLKPEWHLWSIDPGGDGMLVPPTFTFQKNPDIQTYRSGFSRCGWYYTFL